MFRSTAVALLAATALSPAALAQTTTDPNPALDQSQSCLTLIAFVEGGLSKPQNISAEDALIVAEANDPALCDDALRLARGEISTVESAPDYDAEAAERILALIDPDPKVTVRSADPSVTVERGQASVSVDPGQPIVTVRQAAPVVTVETAAPRISIRIPKPEILVEMPDPSVDVASAQPRVTIDQGPPEVTVERGEVEVEVEGGQVGAAANEAAEADGEETPEIASVDTSKVRIEEGGEPEVRVAKPKPQVRYEIDEPKIELGAVAEPEVSIEHTGEATVRFRQLSAEETRRIASQGVGEASERLEQAADDGATETQRYTVVRSSEEAKPGAATATLSVDDMVGLTVYGADGDTVGDVEEIVMIQGETYAIVGNGGFFGLGEKEVALAVGDMVARDDGLMLRRVEEDDIDSMQEVDASDFQDVEAETQIEILAE